MTIIQVIGVLEALARRPEIEIALLFVLRDSGWMNSSWANLKWNRGGIRRIQNGFRIDSEWSQNGFGVDSEWIQNGFRTDSEWIPRMWEDPVRWMHREYNKVADGLADLTMDRRNSWSRKFSPTRFASDCNVIVQTGGGVRNGDCASAAFIIGFCGHSLEGTFYEPILAQGTFIATPCSSFAAEAIALDEATAALKRIVCAP